MPLSFNYLPPNIHQYLKTGVAFGRLSILVNNQGTVEYHILLSINFFNLLDSEPV